MVKMLKVEYDELIARAAELEELADKLVADFPAENPRPPCGVPFVLEVTEDIWNVIDSDRLDLADGADNLRNLAKSLINAAKAYEELDESAAEALDQETQVSEVAPDQAGKGATQAPDSQTDASFLQERWLEETLPVLKRAHQFYEGGDEGANYLSFAGQLKDYARWLNQEVLSSGPFRSFKEWEGESATKVEAELDQHKTWVKSIAKHCLDLGDKADTVVAAYKKRFSTREWDFENDLIPTLGAARTVIRLKKLYAGEGAAMHPQPVLVQWFKDALNDTKIQLSDADDFYSKKGLGKIFTELERLSTEALAKFKEEAKYDDFKSVNAGGTMPGNPPDVGFKIDPPKEETDPPKDPPKDPGDTALPGGGLPTMPGMPTMPEMPSDVPTDAALSDGVVGGVGAGSSKLPTGGLGGMRAASVGGGGGVPSMPLQPPVAAEGAGSAAGRGGTNLGGAGALAGGAAMGGRGGMGMAPMAGQGGKGEDSKAKRAQQDEEALYAEDRPWTEAVIGNRRRKDGPDNKESK